MQENQQLLILSLDQFVQKLTLITFQSFAWETIKLSQNLMKLMIV